MKAIDRYIGFVLCLIAQPIKLVFPRNKTKERKIKKVLALKFWGIGSQVLTSSSLEKIKQKYPQVEVHFLTLKGNFPICRTMRVVDEIIVANLKTNIFFLVYEIIRVVTKLRAEKYDLFLDFEFYTRFSALISFASGAKCTIGFHSWEVCRGRLHDREIPFNHYWHIIENFSNLAVGSSISNNRDYAALPGPVIDERYRRAVCEKLKSDKIMAKDYLVLVNVNSGELALERRWPKQNFARLCSYICANYEIKTILVGSSGEREYVQSVIDIIEEPNNILNWAGQLDLFELSALLERANLLITVDSGPLHIAAAIGTPTVSFFGPETPILYGPRGEKHLVLFADLSCSPCINVENVKTVRCRQFKAECMEAITVERTIAEMEKKYEFPAKQS